MPEIKSQILLDEPTIALRNHKKAHALIATQLITLVVSCRKKLDNSEWKREWKSDVYFA